MSRIQLQTEDLTDTQIVADIRKQKMVAELSTKMNEELGVLEQQYDADRAVIIKKYEDYEKTL